MRPILSVAERRALALAGRDWDAVGRSFIRRSSTSTRNGHRLDRDGYLALLADGPVRWQAQTLHDVAVAVDGQVAVLAATVVDDVLYDGQPARWEFATTRTYVERGGAWLYLAGHTALPAA